MPSFRPKQNVMIYPRKKQGFVGSKADRRGNRTPLSLDLTNVEAMFHMPLKDAADRLDICVTSLKRACRALGIPKWPYVHVKPSKKDIKAAGSTDHSQASTPVPVASPNAEMADGADTDAFESACRSPSCTPADAEPASEVEEHADAHSPAQASGEESAAWEDALWDEDADLAGIEELLKDTNTASDSALWEEASAEGAARTSHGSMWGMSEADEAAIVHAGEEAARCEAGLSRADDEEARWLRGTMEQLYQPASATRRRALFEAVSRIGKRNRDDEEAEAASF